ncbi:beta-1,3-glucanase family protein [Massilia sp. H-1]|nr:beta-1,3-glucanase family protein [Massilia sp. H-1]
MWLEKSVQFGDTFTLKALATKDGKDSPVVSRTYTITNNAESAWNGNTTFNVVNATGGKYADSQVYWLIIGKDWVTGQYVRANASGQLVPVSEADNTIPVPSREGLRQLRGQSGAGAVGDDSADRIGAHLHERGQAGAGADQPRHQRQDRLCLSPDLENSTDPNLNTTFDFGEFNINRPRPVSNYPGIYVNTSRVDIFGLPLKLRVTGLDGYDATVGETLLETRDELFARFVLETPSEFQGLAKAPYSPYRIMAAKRTGPSTTASMSPPARRTSRAARMQPIWMPTSPTSGTSTAAKTWCSRSATGRPSVAAWAWTM